MMNIYKGYFIQSVVIVCFLFSTSLTIKGQNEVLKSGIIYDSQTKEVLPGASIILKGRPANFGTTSDNNGQFNIMVTPSDSVIIVSFTGYQTSDFNILNKTELAVFLNPGISINEVVITALGLERKSKTLGYAVQQLDGSALTMVKSPNFLDNLSGKIAGLNIIAGSSGVGSSSKISIRGESSFTNTNPLFVIDGIPINNNTTVNNTNDDANGFMEVDFGNGAMEINHDDIETVNVLKGPAAAALYGSRASNGAIVIRTKSGKNTKGFGVQFNSSLVAESPFRLPQFQNSYGLGNSGKYEYKDGLGGGINDNITYSFGPAFTPNLSIVQYDSPVTLPDGRVVRAGDTGIHGGLKAEPTPFIAYPNNLKDFYQTGSTFTNNISFTAGGDRSDMRLSLTDLNSVSYIPGVNLQRKTAAISMNFYPIEKLKISTNLNYIHSQSKNRPSTKYGSENINYALVAWFGRSNNIETLKDYWQPGLENVQQFSYNYTFFDNPYFTLLENRNSFGRDRWIGHITANYNVTNHISVQLRSGMDHQQENRTFRRAFSTNRFKNGAFAEQSVFFREINTDLLFNYSKEVDKFSFDFSFGGNRMDQLATIDQLQANILAQPGVYSLNNAAAPLEYFIRAGNKKINSIYSVLKFGYEDWLFLDITGRNDWSSTLATANSTANTSFFYPSISIATVLSQIFTLPEDVSFAKLRVSYANVGNDTGPYQTNGAFSARVPVNGQPSFGVQPTIPNANLLPENITAYETGLDIRFFNDRLRTDITWFRSTNQNQIISLPISNTTGYTQQSINGGAVTTTGWEAIVDFTPIAKNNISWSTMLNFSTYQNKVITLPDEAKTITLAYNSIYDNLNQTIWYQVQEGGRLGDMWGTGYLRNENSDLVVGANGQYVADNRLKNLGNYNPDFMLGWNNQVNYKNFFASFLLDWRQGGIIISRSLALAGVAGQLIETENRPEEGIIAEGVVNIGTSEKPIWSANTQAIPAETYYRMYYDRNHEENNTYDASYLKLREVAIGYKFPTKALLKNINELTLSVTGRNLYAWSKTPHFDPEQFGIQGQNLVSGVEDMGYPTTRSVGLRISLKF
jgi:TonB-linked SusC/RagA family outer membrane protein